MEKDRLIASYKTLYKTHIDGLLLDDNVIEKFWKWFENESVIFDIKNISTSNTAYENVSFGVIDNGCYSNSIKVNQELKYDYYEGFYLIAPQGENINYSSSLNTLSHGFNVVNGDVNDITFQKTNKNNEVHYYVGVKIDEDFIDEVIKYASPINAELINIQLLLSFFLKKTNILKSDDNPQYYLNSETYLSIFQEENEY